MRLRGMLWVATALSVASCGSVADLPLGQPELDEYWKQTDFEPSASARTDESQLAPTTGSAFSPSAVVGQTIVIQGDDTNVSRISEGTTSGFGLRMDTSRQDLARLTHQVISEHGDNFDFIVVLPAFDDLLNPGFAYYSGLRVNERGTGRDVVDIGQWFGSPARLQGILNMNTPAAYSRLDGKRIDDPASAVHAIMGQEISHRWLAFAKVKRDGFNDGQASDVLLGRDEAHWSALMHTGPQDMSGEIYTSVQDGVAWQDNGNGTFTAREVFMDWRRGISAKARFSTLDLYLMGLLPKGSVEPFYVIADAQEADRVFDSTSRITQGTTVRGTRVDFGVDDVIRAIGERVPDAAAAPHRFNMAVVVLTSPGQSLEDARALAEEVDGFRVEFQQRFAEWTGGHGAMCGALDGRCETPEWTIDEVTVQSGGTAQHPRWAVGAVVRNSGLEPSPEAVVMVDSDDGVTDRVTATVPALEPGGTAPVSFQLIARMPCQQDVNATIGIAWDGIVRTEREVRDHRDGSLLRCVTGLARR